MKMQTKIILAIVIIAAAALAIAPALANNVLAAGSPKHKVCPGTGDCNGDSGNHNPNAFCTTNDVNRPNCAGT